jgi:hypothetical protein
MFRHRRMPARTPVKPLAATLVVYAVLALKVAFIQSVSIPSTSPSHPLGHPRCPCITPQAVAATYKAGTSCYMNDKGKADMSMKNGIGTETV